MQKLFFLVTKKLNGSTRQLVLLFCILAVGISACKKDDFDVEKQRTKDEEVIKQYLTDHYLTGTRTNSGLYYVEEVAGTGAQPQKGQTVRVHYRGRYTNGQIFDESYSSGNPIEFKLGVGQVIPGWDEGIALMKQGGKARLLIPSEEAYGPEGSSPIPPNTVLVFETELISIK
jgi:FKBP-type peptidyl-prolyl cis-trans isomerase FkpA